ncbi:MAG: peptidoglycan DD-metalloendopeptidase family protein [Deltaproteobacteria bacterium]|nr:peptidoglycan DD-metalloendopeptidase family protein [Deltaproteobacteria bacterium]
MKRLLLASGIAAVVGAIAMLPASSHATFFRLPLGGCGNATQCGAQAGMSCYVTAYYDHAGKDWNCGTETYESHVGSDFGVGGTAGVRPVLAGAAGLVLETNDGCPTGSWGDTCGGGFGNFVKLRHADGKITIYGHFQSGTLQVHTNQQVTCGTELGKVGSSGNSTGPHLHFEVIDPTYGSDDPYSGDCGGPLTYWVTAGAYCGLPSSTCEGACTPQCSGKQCGPDTCGGTCGTCPSQEYCQATGVCSQVPLDGAEFVSETIPDGTHFDTGEKFTKTWTLRNTGGTSWTKLGGYSFTFTRLEDFDAPARTWPDTNETIAPGATKTWVVPMTAPLVAGTWQGYWKMNVNGTSFGDEVWVSIVVDPPPATFDDAQYVSDSPPDDTRFAPNETFTKMWTMKNTGTSTWTAVNGFRWEFMRGERMGAAASYQQVPGEVTTPGQGKSWSVPMQAPATPGTYRGYWRSTHSGQAFGQEVWVEIIVNPITPEDQDGDGHASILSEGDDCDDHDNSVYPGKAERCDEKDNDCDNRTDEDIPEQVCGAGDCRSTAPGCVGGNVPKCTPLPGTNEDCNGKDDDCNGFTDDLAHCEVGYVCIGARCAPVEVEPDAGTPPAPGRDASQPLPGADAGINTFKGGGCGCGAASGSALVTGGVAFLALALRRRPPRCG